MSKIIAINAGSSSLKFQLFEMPSEKVLTKGLVERIGLDNGIFTISVNDEKDRNNRYPGPLRSRKKCCWINLQNSALSKI